jgi:hypothetical protein
MCDVEFECLLQSCVRLFVVFEEFISLTCNDDLLLFVLSSLCGNDLVHDLLYGKITDHHT